MSRAVDLSSRESPADEVNVIVGVVFDHRDRVLIAQRPTGKHMAGYWEFPGGKMLPGEPPFRGLRRELAEELGIVVKTAERLCERLFFYPDRNVRLDVWWVLAYNGRARALEGQALRWVDVEALGDASLLPADAPIVDAIRARLA